MTVLTIPRIEHICYKIINEGNLRLGDAAGVSVKYWHYNRQALSLLFISLRKIKLQLATRALLTFVLE